MDMKLTLTNKLDIRQSIAVTQQFQNSLKILQLPLQDLRNEIYQEYQENPLLEIEDISSILPNEINGIEDTWIDKFIYKDRVGQTEDVSYANVSNHSERKEAYDPLVFIAHKKQLKDYLKEQIQDLRLDTGWSSLCYILIDNLNKQGYLEEDIEELSLVFGIDQCIMKKALSILQSIEPDGIGARDLKECLILQLKKKGIKEEGIYHLIENNLHLVGEFKLKQIAKEMNLDIETVTSYCSIIKNLEPHPARGFYTGEPELYIVPEAYIRENDGKITLLINDQFLPSLKICSIHKEVLNAETSQETVQYIHEKTRRAQEFINDVENRKKTVHRVIQAIIERQHEYFQLGPKHLKVMKMKEISYDLNLHVSTVSRAIKDKYISTPHRFILIKDLFTSGLSTNNRDTNPISDNGVKLEIVKLIEHESKSKPLSDQDISNQLNLKGVPISRRTVAKYREELGILTSAKRKTAFTIKSPLKK